MPQAVHFDDEEHGRDRRVVGRRKARCGAGSDERADLPLTQTKQTTQGAAQAH